MTDKLTIEKVRILGRVRCMLRRVKELKLKERPSHFLSVKEIINTKISWINLISEKLWIDWVISNYCRISLIVFFLLFQVVFFILFFNIYFFRCRVLNFLALLITSESFKIFINQFVYLLSGILLNNFLIVLWNWVFLPLISVTKTCD